MIVGCPRGRGRSKSTNHISDGHCGHGFDDDDGSGEMALVVAAAGLPGVEIAVGVEAFGGLVDGDDGVKGGAEYDGHAVAYAALDAAAMVGFS